MWLKNGNHWQKVTILNNRIGTCTHTTFVSYRFHFRPSFSDHSIVFVSCKILKKDTKAFVVVCSTEAEYKKMYDADVCYKAYYIFNLAYPEACQHMWRFIGRQFYNLSDGEKAAKTTLELLNAIQCLYYIFFLFISLQTNAIYHFNMLCFSDNKFSVLGALGTNEFGNRDVRYRKSAVYEHKQRIIANDQ